MNISDTLKNMIDNLPPRDQDTVYRYLWMQRVVEDIETFAEEREIDLTDEEIDIIAERYVCEGDYDCNFSYWDNLENLINDVHKK